MQRRDYLERLIEQIVAAIARIAGLAREGRFDEAERELDATWTSGLGFRRADALRLDVPTLKMMLGAKAGMAARLLEAQADLEELRGKSAPAETLRRRAGELRV